MTTKKIITLFIIAQSLSLLGAFLYTSTSLPQIISHVVMVVGIILNIVSFFYIIKIILRRFNKYPNQ